MEIITEFLNWCMMLFLKIIVAAGIVAVIVTLLLFLGCFLLVKGTDYLQDKIDSFTEKPPDNNNTLLAPPEPDSADSYKICLKGNNTYGINMEGMNGYPGGYGDEQMFEDEEEFQGMDYGLLDDEAKDESNDSGEF